MNTKAITGSILLTTAAVGFVAVTAARRSPTVERVDFDRVELGRGLAAFAASAGGERQGEERGEDDPRHAPVLIAGRDLVEKGRKGIGERGVDSGEIGGTGLFQPKQLGGPVAGVENAPGSRPHLRRIERLP